MADEGAVAVAEAPVVDAGAESFVDTAPEPENQPEAKPEADKLDGRRQPDALRKRIAALKSQADAVADPNEKASLLADAQALNNKVGKVGAYEQVYPTVREARETKALADSFAYTTPDGRKVTAAEGIAEARATLSNIQQIDQQLEAGDPAVNTRMWDEAPQGMTKLAPLIFAELEKRNPQEYQKAVAPHAVRFLDGSGFPEAFDHMVELYRGGKTEDAEKLREELAGWVQSQRQGVKEAPKANPEVERLQRELEERKTKESAAETNRAYNDVIAHAGPVIDKYLKPIVAKLGLSPNQYSKLRREAWQHLQDTRNADQTYKTVANGKYREGMDAALAYVKSETEARAEDAAKYAANETYGHQLKNGAVVRPNPTAAPISQGITRGKEPTPSEIDYSAKGIQVAKKQGFKDLSDMILAGKAPLKAGGIRQWR